MKILILSDEIKSEFVILISKFSNIITRHDNEDAISILEE